MKSISKAIFIILVSFVLIIQIPVYSNAGGQEDNFWTNAGSFLDDEDNGASGGAPDLTGIFGSISDVLFAIACGVTGVSAAAMGINFLIQSVEDKAKIKESMVPWIIGILISFGAFGIWSLTIRMLNSAF